MRSCWISVAFITKFSKTETETFFRDQIFRNWSRDFFWGQFFLIRNWDFFPRPNSPKPKPSKNWQKSRNREVLKPKCQSVLQSVFSKQGKELSQNWRKTQNNFYWGRGGKYLLQEAKKNTLLPSPFSFSFMDQIFLFSKIIILYALFLEQKFVERVLFCLKTLFRYTLMKKVFPVIQKVFGY